MSCAGAAAGASWSSRLLAPVQPRGHTASVPPGLLPAAAGFLAVVVAVTRIARAGAHPAQSERTANRAILIAGCALIALAVVLLFTQSTG